MNPATATLPADATPRRVEYVAAELLAPIASPSQARKLARKGALLLNGEPASPGTLAQPGDVLQLVPPEAPRHKVLALDLPVVFEDDWMAVVVKPPGLPVSGNQHRTLVRALPHNLTPSTQPDALAIPHSVHRLDIRTGGLVVVAKCARANVALGHAFQERRVHKRYRAVLVGRLEGTGVVDQPIEERAARSRYVARWHTPSVRLGWLTTVDLFPETGRTHQLRRHVAGLGHPVLGDDLYTGEVANVAKKGLYLWATGLTLDHPRTGEALTVETEPGPRFARIRAGHLRHWCRSRGLPVGEAGE